MRVPVEDGARVTVVYTHRMTRLAADGSPIALTGQEQALLLPRVLLGMDELLDGSFEVDEQAPCATTAVASLRHLTCRSGC